MAKYPQNQHAEIALGELNRLITEKSMEAFIPTAKQIFRRGEIFFSLYHYNNAIEEFSKLLLKDYFPHLSEEIHSRTLFKLGMCY